MVRIWTGTLFGIGAIYIWIDSGFGLAVIVMMLIGLAFSTAGTKARDRDQREEREEARSEQMLQYLEEQRERERRQGQHRSGAASLEPSVAELERRNAALERRLEELERQQRADDPRR